MIFYFLTEIEPKWAKILGKEPAPLDITSDITLDITFLYQILLSKFPHRHHIKKCDVAICYMPITVISCIPLYNVMSDVMSKDVLTY